MVLKPCCLANWRTSFPTLEAAAVWSNQSPVVRSFVGYPADPYCPLGRLAFHPLVGPPHVPAVDASPERYELRSQRRGRARRVLCVGLPERSGGDRFLQGLAGPDSFSHRFNQLTQIEQVTTQDRPRSQR